ncbi:G-protein alpha subunit [Ceratobasidium sp. AG-Ba]|nr:G-protein alpha subunit [Ceratobasidium sp. AG-Ba]
MRNMQDPQAQSFARLRLRLTPLRSVEASIVESLSSPGELARTRTQNLISVRTSRSSHSPASRSNTPEMEEYEDVYAHPESRWHRVLYRCMRTTNAVPGRASTSQRSEMLPDDDDAPAVTLQACAADMRQIWGCPVIQQYLKEQGLFMEEQSGLLILAVFSTTSNGSLPKAMSRPMANDILRTRVKTIAPTETVLPNLEPGLEWRLYDVGGARRQRAKWAPFFDDMDLIIVLVPVSAFDQVLAEDKEINRLRDSFELWDELCQTKALYHIPTLLFLNKCDLLDKKLKAGIRLAEYLTSYEGKPNETKKALNYLSKRFAAMRKDSTAPQNTPCYIHHTSVVDIETTHTVIAYVRDKIILGQMRDSYFV